MTLLLIPVADALPVLREHSTRRPKTADLVTTPALPQEFAFSNGLYVPLCE